MLNHVGELNVYKNGFVSLMKCNDYCIEKFINFVIKYHYPTRGTFVKEVINKLERII